MRGHGELENDQRDDRNNVNNNVNSNNNSLLGVLEEDVMTRNIEAYLQEHANDTNINPYSNNNSSSNLVNNTNRL